MKTIVMELPGEKASIFLKGNVIARLVDATKCDFTLAGNSLTISGSINQVELAKIKISVIVDDSDPLKPKNESLNQLSNRKLDDQWKQLYSLILKRENMENNNYSPIGVLKDYLELYTGIPYNQKMNGDILKLWLAMDVREQTFWFNVCLQNNKLIREQHGEVDIQIRNLNRKIALNSETMPSLPLGKFLHYQTNSKDMIHIKTKFYCQFGNCKASYTIKHSLRNHQSTCKFKKQIVSQCRHCFITCLTGNGLKRHIERLHPETIEIMPVSLANSCLEKDVAEVAEEPFPLIHEVCINMPNFERAIIAFKCGFWFVDGIRQQVIRIFFYI
uniref:Uncharacterized protein n=1 Tax=Daphnia galeata TaxID=27404 RepID=A0A8J2S7X9_9CRUS|nr:unnamed protein product [Daphnia galeata]